jgi:acyl-CoA synthetase (AMP-forming)/AMP-acid ligase II
MTAPAATMPESTYELVASAARTWPDAVATQWIPDPADYARCGDISYAELAGTVTRIANGLARLGIQREHAVTLCGPNSSGLLAATLAAQAAGIAAPVSPALGADRIAGLIARAGSPVLIAAGPEADLGLWQRLTAVARQAGMRAVIALRPDGAMGVPPALDAGPGLPALYLDELADGQPAGSLAGIRPPGAADLAAFAPARHWTPASWGSWSSTHRPTGRIPRREPGPRRTWRWPRSPPRSARSWTLPTPEESASRRAWPSARPSGPVGPGWG